MQTPNDQKLNQIMDSLTNGQKEQFVNQIKDYGVSRFHVDLWDHLTCFDPTQASIKYTHAIITYHKVNQSLRD